MEITILEGARGTGKSTLAFKLRQKNSETTLINFTGFHEDGDKGLVKSYVYYSAFMQFLNRLSNHDSKFVFDRFFFSEKVYSSLYKEYDFGDSYNYLLDELKFLSEIGVKINIFQLTINDEKELEQRLIRDKVPFGKAVESVKETLKQQELYEELFNSLHSHTNSNLKIFKIDTSSKTMDEVYDEITTLKTAI